MEEDKMVDELRKEMKGLLQDLFVQAVTADCQAMVTAAKEDNLKLFLEIVARVYIHGNIAFMMTLRREKWELFFADLIKVTAKTFIETSARAGIKLNVMV